MNRRTVFVLLIMSTLGMSLLARTGGTHAAFMQATSQPTDAPTATPQPTATQFPMPSTAKVTITVGNFGNANVAFAAVLADWYKEHPEIGVVLDNQSFDDHHTKLLSAITAGQGAPDVAMIELSQIFKFTDVGGLVNLLDKPYDAGKYKAAFVPYKWTQGTTPDGRVVAMPWDIGPQTLFYRRDLFEAAGLKSDPDAVYTQLNTWKGMLEAAKKITDPKKKVYFMANASDLFMMYFMNANLFDKNLKPVVNTPENVEALKAMQQLHQDNLVARVDMWSADWFTLLPNGGLALQPVAAWFGSALKGDLAPDAKGKWGVAKMPWKQGNWGGSFLAIPEQSKHKDEAWKFIAFMMTRADVQNKMFKATDYMPALKSAWTDKFYDEPDEYYGGEKVRQLWVAIANEVGDIQATPLDVKAADILKTHVVTCINENTDAKKCLDEANDDIDKQIAPDRDALLQGKK